MLYYPIAQSGRFDIDPIGLQTPAVGDAVSLNLNGFLTSDAPSVSWSVSEGALPPGVFLSAEGMLTGTVLGTGGVYVAMVQADAGPLGLAAQALAFHLPSEGEAPVDVTVWATGSGGDVVDYVDENGAVRRAYVFDASGVFTCATAGWALVRMLAGGGGTGIASGGSGGGAGGFLEARVWIEAGTHPLVVGAGGTWGTGGLTDPNRHGYRGNDTLAFGLIAQGGGGGRGVTTNAANLARTNGGSGGGGCFLPGTPAAAYGPGSGYAYQGSNGGSAPTSGTTHFGAAGGGAGGVGNGTNGGPGKLYLLNTTRAVCGGGAGSQHVSGPTSLGTASHGAAPNTNGAVNTGAGGSAVNDGSAGRAGGSGRVEIIIGV